MAKLYEYRTSCIHSTAELIHAMKDTAEAVDYDTMLRNCQGLLDWSEELAYFRHPAQGLTLKNDWHVAYFRSYYDGLPCFFLTHSAIEYIWTYWNGR